ncbi:hypothetical protein NDU88_008185 [Pleurodeles waltl]|uniref:Uncharacterized protein n=1 Tax=Pleurodeles waltl TaxID=8319 RepID=A0AAV7SUG1_PLEWA|nr:hypothetical protein NDU88_008185 [Pleurodeles waltl]
MRAQASEENGERGAGETSGVDRGIEQQQESDPEPRGFDKQPDSGPEESTLVTAAREAPGEFSSHASGGAWQYQKEKRWLIPGAAIVVRQDLVKPEQWAPHTKVLITYVHGDQRLYPVATIILNWKGVEEQITVGMIPTLGEDLIIRTDYENFTPLLARASQDYVTNIWWEEAPYGKAEVEESPLRLKLNRKQKREQWQYYNAAPAMGSPKPGPQAATVLTMIESFRQAQREDPTLKNA